jgi:Flp pilus assembly protein TadG
LVRRHDDRRANVAITFAFASLPILGFVAAAVDYSRANSVKAAMQTALDSTALMLAKEAATDTEDQLKANALKYFTAVFARPEAKDILVNVTYTTAGGSKIVVNATAAMDAEFTKLLGYDTYHINASSTAKWGTRRLRVALVLDNTGSMADAGKMAALKTATKGLLSQLQGAVTQPGDVYVSIVPFVKDVNLGASNWNANWIYWGSATQDPGETDNTSWEALHGTCDSNSTYNNDRNRCRTRGGVCSNTSFHATKHLHNQRHVQRGQPDVAKHLRKQGHLQRRGQHNPNRMQLGRDLQSRRLHDPDRLPERRDMRHIRLHDSKHLPKRTTLLDRRLEHQNSVPEPRRHLAARCLDLDPRIVDPRDLDPCDLYRVHLDAGHLDACEPQYVERLRDGSRQLGWSRRDVQLRHNVRRAGSSHAAVVVAVPRRAVRVLPAGREAIE